MNTLNRRSFLKRSFAAGAALSLPAYSWAQVPGANEDIRLAVIGFNGRGKSHINGFSKVKGVRLVALCDADKSVLEHAAANLSKDGTQVETYTDVRKLLEN